MLLITYFAGPHEGQTEELKETDPESYLDQLIDLDIPWRIDYSQASTSEIGKWHHIDFVKTSKLMLKSGVPVKLKDKLYYTIDTLLDAVLNLDESSFLSGELHEDGFWLIMVNKAN